MVNRTVMISMPILILWCTFLFSPIFTSIAWFGKCFCINTFSSWDSCYDTIQWSVPTSLPHSIKANSNISNSVIRSYILKCCGCFFSCFQHWFLSRFNIVVMYRIHWWYAVFCIGGGIFMQRQNVSIALCPFPISLKARTARQLMSHPLLPLLLEENFTSFE